MLRLGQTRHVLGTQHGLIPLVVRVATHPLIFEDLLARMATVVRTVPAEALGFVWRWLAHELEQDPFEKPKDV
jgi:hypothetical protein